MTGRLIVALCGACAFLSSTTAAQDGQVIGGHFDPLPVAFRDVPILKAVYSGGGQGGGLSASCPQVISSHTNSSFTGGSYVVQAGFAEPEMAAVSYTVVADKFPLRIDLIEDIIACSGTNISTTTEWSILVYEGTPATGTLVYQASSDNKLLPHIILPPGTNGVNLNFSVDPADPDQWYVYDNGSHTFSVAFRIDNHNNQTQNPCLVAPPSNSNAFPTTDVGGLHVSSGNWLWALNCGAFGCPPGWTTFAQLPTYCRPSGDWVMRVTWTPLNCGPVVGACCLASGTCVSLDATACGLQGGTYQGDNSDCATAGCTVPTGPCCFASTGACLNLSSSDCTMVGGVPGPAGQSCTGYVCFPTGACCLPNGSCAGPISPQACAALGGAWQGNATSCATTNCPLPTGAACFPNGACLVLTEAQANAVGASWAGPGTNCVDGNANGTADACEVGDPADFNGDGAVNGGDLASLLGAWGSNLDLFDLDNSGLVDGADLSTFLSHWTG